MGWPHRALQCTVHKPLLLLNAATLQCKAFLFGLAIEDASRALRCSSTEYSGRSPSGLRRSPSELAIVVALGPVDK